MADSELSIEIRQIEPGDRLTGLSLGDEKFNPLKTFLQQKAKSFQEKSLGRTYAVFKNSEKGLKVIAYMTLVCGEIVIEEGDNLDVDVEYRYKHYPAIKIARLATDRRVQGSGIGRRLVDLALGTAQDIICPAVGCRFVVVDSKKEAVQFYLKCGFTFLDTPSNREREAPVMFVDLQKTAR